MAGGALVGIDLGTTYSLVATLQGGVPRCLPNALGEHLTPSAVSVADDGTVLVGAAARARAATHPTTTALAFKRDMGTDRVWRLGRRTFRAEDLSALVLGELKRDAESALQESIDEAVVTVPAYFGELQRRATRDACAIAGLRVERIINEPTAAALAYGLHERHREFRAVVIDLGGGTFDVTVLEIMEGVIEIQASAGDTRLGGEDFVDALVAICTARLREQYGHALEEDQLAQHARLREACELAKRRLSSEARAAVVLPGFLHPRAAARPAADTPAGGDVELWIGRDEAESAWAELLRRIETPIRRALRDAGARTGQISEVLLVGGATRMPCVVELAARVFGRLPLRSLPADESVAMGAAVQVALKAGNEAVADMVVTDVAPFTLGIAVTETLAGDAVDGLFAPILERGTVLPASRTKSFVTLADNQTRIKIEVYQGEHASCRDNQKLGEYELRGIPRAPAGEQVVDVRFSYDLNGLLEVDMTVRSTGATNTLTLQRGSRSLSAKELEAAREALQRLKFHPREALPNVTTLNRADALYVELTGPARVQLGMAMAQFKLALEQQDPAAIEAERSRLLALMAALGHQSTRGV